MRDLLELLTVPVAVIALCVILAVVGGIENGTISFPVALLITTAMVGIETAVIRVFKKKGGTGGWQARRIKKGN